MTLFLIVFGVAICLITEKLAQSFGLGNVLIYDSHPIYGYRPQPNQVVFRSKDKPIKINNLGLRAETNWDLNQTNNKVLFVGDSVTYGGSYIKNTDLFSHLASQLLPGYESANAGVNAWGVLNVYALIKEMNFLPADVYVSVFPEGDFYRGLMRIGGQPFWTRPPKFALEELLHYFFYRIQLGQVPPIHFYSLSSDEKYKIAKQAAYYLKQYDNHLKQAGKQHLIYITPSRSQLLNQQTHDLLVEKALKEENLQVVYLKDKIELQSENQINALFHDEIHLSETGHALWATLIGTDLKNLLT